MKKSTKFAAAVASTVMFGSVLAGGAAQPADAARQSYFRYSHVSQRATLLVFSTTRCTGRNNTVLAKGESTRLGVNGIWVPKGYSVWRITSGGHWRRIAHFDPERSYCKSMTGIANEDAWWATRKGNNWDAG